LIKSEAGRYEDEMGTIEKFPGRDDKDQKLKELVLYVASRAFKDPGYGAVKLNKILFYADFLSFFELGKSITGAEYRKYQNGPAPASMKYVKKELEASDDAYEYNNPVGNGWTSKQLLAKRAANIDLFSPQEIDIVNRVIQELWGATGTAVSEMSHGFPGWRLAKYDEPIPYFTAFIPETPIELSDEELEWAKREAEVIAHTGA
jgi:hypothetical protein